MEIFNENPMAIKWTITPKIAAKIKLSKIIQTITNVMIDGIAIIAAIIVPLRAI